MRKLNEIESRLLSEVYDLPTDIAPYSAIAKKLGYTEGELIASLRNLIGRGIVRRFGAILKHTKAGLKANALFVAKVEDSTLDRVVRPFVDSRNVTHCYLRTSSDIWPYNFYAMIHASTKSELKASARHLAKEAKISDYKLLFSVKEFKKTGWRWKK